jgi:hypothetical protein
MSESFAEKTKTRAMMLELSTIASLKRMEKEQMNRKVEAEEELARIMKELGELRLHDSALTSASIDSSGEDGDWEDTSTPTELESLRTEVEVFRRIKSEAAFLEREVTCLRKRELEVIAKIVQLRKDCAEARLEAQREQERLRSELVNNSMRDAAIGEKATLLDKSILHEGDRMALVLQKMKAQTAQVGRLYETKGRGVRLAPLSLGSHIFRSSFALFSFLFSLHPLSPYFHSKPLKKTHLSGRSSKTSSESVGNRKPPSSSAWRLPRLLVRQRMCR